MTGSYKNILNAIKQETQEIKKKLKGIDDKRKDIFQKTQYSIDQKLNYEETDVKFYLKRLEI